MLNIKHILLAKDFSEESDAALAVAADLSRRLDAQLHVVFVEVLHGYPYDPVHRITLSPEFIEARMQAAVSGAVKDDTMLRVRPKVLRGVEATSALIEYAQNQAIDLIVMGTRGHRGVRRFLLGSVAETIVRMAPCPVLTVRRPGASEVAHSFDRILVPVDFSKHARDMLRYAKSLGALFGARLTLLHVIEEAFHPAFYGPALQSIYDIDPDIDRKVLTHLKTFYVQTEGPAAEVEFVVRAGHAAKQILDYAEEEAHDLIVMGTHGLSGIERFVTGSVVEKVIRRAPCPVFVVKSFGKSLLPVLEAGALLEPHEG